MPTETPKPPRWADRLLSWLVAPHLREEVLGDLHERYQLRVQRLGETQARRRYWRDLLAYVRPAFIKRKPNQDTAPFFLSSDMILNYLKIAIRNLVKNRVYSFINIAGLAIGLACCLAIGLYVWDEYSYDRFHRHGQHIYRVVEKQNQAGTLYNIASTPGPLASALQADFAEIQQTCRMGRYWGLLQRGSTTIAPTDLLSVDPSFFSLFDFPLVRGNTQKALLGPDEMVISERMADRFFGASWRQSANVLGQSFKFNDSQTFTLVGIARNAPHNSHIQFDVLFSYRYTESNTEEYKWNNDNYYTYLRLSPEADVSALNQKVFRYLARYRPQDKPTLSLQPLWDIYLNTTFDFHTDWKTKGSRLYLRIFVAVGLIVLLIALFNFMNLATARAMKRAQEVGVRKAIGALRQQLVVQFLGESLLMTVLAIGLAFLLLQGVLPLLNEIAGKSLAIPIVNPFFGLVMVGLVLIISLLAGLYPAFYLSGFQPIKVLKGVFDVRSGQLFRRTLVVSQFTMSVMLVIGAIVIYQQLTFLQDRNLGFDQSQLVHVWMRDGLRPKAGLLKTDLQQQSSIATVAASSGNLVDMDNSTYDVGWEGQPAGDGFVITHINIDPDFLATTGMTLVAGRNFDQRITTDTSSAYLINETAARRMNWTAEQALGKTVTFWGQKGKVIGVVHDFHFRPLTATIEPFLFRYWPKEINNYSSLLVKTRPHQTREALAAVEKLIKKYDRRTAPHYEFVDQALEDQYQTEQRTGRIVLYFSVLAIMVSCLGLFGLAAFTAEQRTKEIGVRKVFGASVPDIVALLSRDFLRLILIAVVIATPVAWYAMQKWLQGFAYKIDLAWWMFALASLLVVGIALLTVSFQSVKAALVNPVRSLRSE